MLRFSDTFLKSPLPSGKPYGPEAVRALDEIAICSNKRSDTFCKKLEKRINDKIDEWHDSDSDLELHEFLGWSWEEYIDWVDKGWAPEREYL